MVTVVTGSVQESVEEGSPGLARLPWAAHLDVTPSVQSPFLPLQRAARATDEVATLSVEVTVDTIFLHALEVSCVIGTHAHERRAPQELLIDLDLETDCTRAGSSDDLADTVDYEALTARIRETAEAGKFHLIEAVAAAVAKVTLSSCPEVKALAVRVTKMGAVPGAAAVGVEIRRARRGCRQ